MKITILFVATMLSLWGVSGRAQSTLNYTAGPGQRDVLFNGTPVPNGNQAQVGYFNSGFDVSANVLNASALLGAWHELDTTPITTIFAQPGRFADTVSTSDPQFAGQRMCLWIFKTSDDAAPNFGSGNITAYGLFSANLANWLFPLSGAVPPANTTSIDSSEINQALFGGFDSSHLFLNAVPEPSTRALLILIAGVSACLVRTRLRTRASH